ncbi:MAG: electron transfer flavoprotein subunit alpha/FixB family protein [Leeuwenhoekiella sp.]
MSVLVYIESDEGKFKKTAYEVASYGRGVADAMGTSVTGLTFNASETGSLAAYGVDKALTVSGDQFSKFNANAVATALAQAAEQEGSKVVIVSSSANAKYVAPLLAAKLQAGYASNVVALPDSTQPFTVKRTAFTNKAFNSTIIETEVKIIGLSKNAYGLHEKSADLKEEIFSPNIDDADLGVTVQSVDKATDKVTIADAEIVVSGGRGLKGPENWGMVEEMANILGAATACSKPVSDMGWRPHGEHVGQTGKPVASNLYIAIGISGAIQHLAGINASKTKVVINSDPEAPFFGAADYGVVGDAFDIVPQLNEKLRAFKANNS